MNEQERQQEESRLELTLGEIKKQLALSKESCNIQDSKLNTALLNYWQQGGGNAGDEAQLVETVDRQRALSSVIHSASLKLRKMVDSPYFGRIDFAEDDDGCTATAEQIYIGISTLIHKETGEFLVYDWRTPIAGMFYDFGLGKAWYECLEGTIHGDILLKRQYKVTHGAMQYMFSSDLKIEDEILQELLGKSADDKMHTIVNSIQREQNQIVRDEGHKALFVEGPAGSGKTSVALHRIAFLLYRDRARITSKNVLILSPNHLFSDYISDVLPELGEENVPQMTFQDYVSRSSACLSIQFEARSSHLESILSNLNDEEQATRAANIRFKSSRAFELAIQAYLDWMKTSMIDDYPDIEFRGQTIFSQEDWKHYYLDSFSMMPPTVRLEKLQRLIQTRMRPIVHTVREEKEAKIIETAEEVNEKVIKAIARIHARQELHPLVDKIEEITHINPLAEYKKLFADSLLTPHLLSAGTLPEKWEAIQHQTLFFLNQDILPYEDIPPFLYFQGVLEGFLAKPDIKHLVIDEAQDYTSLQYKILAELFPNCSWTIVGDPLQTIHPYLNSTSFQAASTIIGIDHLFMFRLTRSYRSTKQIQTFCQALLPSLGDVKPIDRPGPLPSVMRVKAIEDLPPTLLHTIQSILAEGWRSIGIICKNTEDSTMVFAALKDHINLTLIIREEDQFHRGIVVMPSYLAKGLEFDAVLVIHADAAHYSQDEERHIFYIICTRALHRLHLFYLGIPSPFLKTMDQSLYNTIEA